MPIYGLTTGEPARLNQPLNSFTSNSRCLGIKPCGIGYGRYLAPKKSRSSFGRPSESACPLNPSLPIGANTWTLFAPDANPTKPLFIFSGIALGQEKSGAKPQEYCPSLSSPYPCKIGFMKMPTQKGLPILTSSLGTSYSRSLVGNFGWPGMKEFLTISPSPNMPSFILRYKLPLNSIS